MKPFSAMNTRSYLFPLIVLSLLVASIIEGVSPD
jgi:hypothetical protein